MAPAFIAHSSIEIILGTFIQHDQISDGDLAWLFNDIDGVIEGFDIQKYIDWDMVAILAEVPSDLNELR